MIGCLRPTAAVTTGVQCLPLWQRLMATQVVMEVRKSTKKDSGAVLRALEEVRTQIMSESGLCPTRLVSGVGRRKR